MGLVGRLLGLEPALAAAHGHGCVCGVAVLQAACWSVPAGGAGWAVCWPCRAMPAAVCMVLGAKSCRWLGCMPELKLPVRLVLGVMTACATDVRQGLPCQLAGVATQVECVCCVSRWSPVSLQAPLPLLLAGRTAARNSKRPVGNTLSGLHLPNSHRLSYRGWEQPQTCTGMITGPTHGCHAH
jgi:hypothetical protein